MKWERWGGCSMLYLSFLLLRDAGEEEMEMEMERQMEITGRKEKRDGGKGTRIGCEKESDDTIGTNIPRRVRC